MLGYFLKKKNKFRYRKLNENLDTNILMESSSDSEEDSEFELESDLVSDLLHKFCKKDSYRNFNTDHIPLLNETIQIRTKVFQKLNIKINNEIVANLSENQFYFLNKFLKEKPFSVLQCDKNIGTLIISNEDKSKLGS